MNLQSRQLNTIHWLIQVIWSIILYGYVGANCCTYYYLILLTCIGWNLAHFSNFINIRGYQCALEARSQLPKNCIILHDWHSNNMQPFMPWYNILGCPGRFWHLYGESSNKAFQWVSGGVKLWPSSEYTLDTSVVHSVWENFHALTSKYHYILNHSWHFMTYSMDIMHVL